MSTYSLLETPPPGTLALASADWISGGDDSLVSTSTLTVLERLDLDTEKPTAEETAKKFGFEDDFYSGSISWWQKTKPKIWSTFDEPYSSSLAKVSWK